MSLSLESCIQMFDYFYILIVVCDLMKIFLLNSYCDRNDNSCFVRRHLNIKSPSFVVIDLFFFIALYLLIRLNVITNVSKLLYVNVILAMLLYFIIFYSRSLVSNMNTPFLLNKMCFLYRLPDFEIMSAGLRNKVYALLLSLLFMLLLMFLFDVFYCIF